MAPLGGRLLQELAPRGHPREEVGHLDPGALGPRGLALLEPPAVVHPDLDSRGLAPAPRAQAQARDRGDGGERLAPEAEAPDALEILEPRQLAGRVALEGQPGVLGAHAQAVVGHGDQRGPAVPDLDPDPAGLGVEGVLDQLLGHRGGSLDDLSGGDLVHQGVRKPPDAPHRLQTRIGPSGLLPRVLRVRRL